LQFLLDLQFINKLYYNQFQMLQAKLETLQNKLTCCLNRKD